MNPQFKERMIKIFLSEKLGSRPIPDVSDAVFAYLNRRAAFRRYLVYAASLVLLIGSVLFYMLFNNMSTVHIETNTKHYANFRKGDVLRTEEVSETISFKEGVEVTVYKNTELILLENVPQLRFELIRGGIKCNTKDSPNGIIVSTPYGQAEIRSVQTEIYMSTVESVDTLKINCIQGQVRLIEKDGNVHIIKSGKKFEMRNNTLKKGNTVLRHTHVTHKQSSGNIKKTQKDKERDIQTSGNKEKENKNSVVKKVTDVQKQSTNQNANLKEPKGQEDTYTPEKKKEDDNSLKQQKEEKDALNKDKGDDGQKEQDVENERKRLSAPVRLHSLRKQQQRGNRTQNRYGRQ